MLGNQAYNGQDATALITPTRPIHQAVGGRSVMPADHPNKIRRGLKPKPFDEQVVVAANGCHEWQGSTNYGYGRFWLDGKNWRAHRYAWVRANGEIPNGLVVMHKCDNTRCVRLDHLQLGTQADNIRDKEQKGRVAHGERNASTWLTVEDVREIRKNHRRNQYKGEWTTAWVADKYGLEKSAVRKIVRGANWKYA